MKTVQLRRYTVAADQIDEFLRWFPRAAATRVGHGFEVEFAYLNRKDCEFTWAVSLRGDEAEFVAAEEAWRTDPVRAEVYGDLPNHCIIRHFVARVEAVIPSGD